MLEAYICQGSQGQIVRASTYQAGQAWDQLGRLLQPYMAHGKQVLAISVLGQPSAHTTREDPFFCYASARLAGITWYGVMR